MIRFAAWTLLASTLFTSSAAQAVTLFQPNSATASSEFNSLYDIGNAIDGSGLPAGFGPGDAHDTYATHNHWTTAANQVPGATASFFFNDDTTIGTLFLWNHRSNGVASNPNYEVTLFDLALFDGVGNPLHTLTNQTPAGETATAQAFPVAAAPIAGVRRVDFVIKANQGQGINNPNYTGIAEIAFAAVVVPEPTTAALLLASGLLAIQPRRR